MAYIGAKKLNELYDGRTSRIRDAINMRMPDRIPVYTQTGTWPCFYSGITVQEALYDPYKLAAAFEKMISDFGWDAVSMSGLWLASIWDAVGSNRYVIPGKELPPDVMFQFPDASPMKAEEYDQLIEDPYNYMITTIIPRVCKESSEPGPRSIISLIKGAIEFGRLQALSGFQLTWWKEAYGMPAATRGTTSAPFDLLGDRLRGFRGIMLDVRRYSDKVEQACEALLPYCIKRAEASAGQPSDLPPVFIPLHIGTFLSPKEFERFYWPAFKELIVELARKGYTMHIFFEYDWTIFLDRIATLPSKRIVAHFEKTDMVKAKAVIGDHICIAGNFSGNVLTLGSIGEVERNCDKLIRELGEGGGYIMATDVVMPHNAKPENVKAMIEYTKKHGVYKR